jgi:hypothetical protein
MSPLLEIVAACVLGIMLLVVARESRSRHRAKFGPAPRGSFLRALTWFASCSIALAFLAWWAAPAFWALLVLLVVASQLAGRFQAVAWGPWQQFRDGAVGASIVTAPLVAVALALTKG